MGAFLSLRSEGGEAGGTGQGEGEHIRGLLTPHQRHVRGSVGGAWVPALLPDQAQGASVN